MKESWYVGDLCYVLDDSSPERKVWSEVCNLMFPAELVTAFGPRRKNGEFRLSDGRQFFSFGTAYGDGFYEDQFGNGYGVDSGSIGAIRVRDIPDFNYPGLGQIHEITDLRAEDCSYKDGVITIGHLLINTNN